MCLVSDRIAGSAMNWCDEVLEHHGRAWQVTGWGHVPTPEERQSAGSRQPGRV